MSSKLGFEGVFEHLIFMDLGSGLKIFLVKMMLNKSSEGQARVDFVNIHNFSPRRLQSNLRPDM